MTDLSPDELLTRAAEAVAAARKAGADAADARFDATEEIGIGVRMGVLEDVGRSEDMGLSLRVFVGQRAASVSTSTLDGGSIAALAERAVAMAQAAPEDPLAGLAPEELLLRGPIADLDLADAALPDPVALREAALIAEDAARSVAGITNSEGGSAAANSGIHALVTSHGFAGVYRVTGHTLAASVLAGEGERMQRDSDWHSARHIVDLEQAATIGRRAGERAVAKLDPGRMPSGRLPVVFDPRTARSLVGHIMAAMAGSMIARGTSYLLDYEGKRILPAGTRISNDPAIPRAMRSRPFDGEGLPAAAGDLIADGCITGWLLDSASARKLGRQPTGHTGRGGSIATANVTFHPGSRSRAELIADIADGVLVTELVGQGIDYVTGDYSRAATGFRIVKGEIAGPVTGFTIAGNLLDMFSDLLAANDLDTRTATHVPSLRSDRLTIAGD